MHMDVAAVVMPVRVGADKGLMAGEMLFTELLPQRLQGKPDMPPRCAACPANMYADHSLRLAQEIVTKNFFLRLLRQKGQGRRQAPHDTERRSGRRR